MDSLVSWMWSGLAGVLSVILFVVSWGALGSVIFAIIGMLRGRCKWAQLAVYVLLALVASLLFKSLFWVSDKIAKPDMVSTALFWGSALLGVLGSIREVPRLLKVTWLETNGGVPRDQDSAALSSFGTLDSRKQTAIWTARWLLELPQHRPGRTPVEITKAALQARYQSPATPRPELYVKAMTFVNAGLIKDARELCHMIAELELLNHLTPEQRDALELGDENIVAATYRAMDEELAKYGL